MLQASGKSGGYCRGKRIVHMDQVRGPGGNYRRPPGCDGALTAKEGLQRRAVCFFGALGQGLLYEVMNLAQLWKLPVLYVCENNQYNEYTHYSETTAGELAARAQAFGIHTEIVDGQDVRAVYETARRLVERARRGEGPAFLQCNTYRFLGHHVGDVSRTYYRSKEEELEWSGQRDPLKILASWLVGQDPASQELLGQIDVEVREEIEAGANFALNAPYPDLEEVDKHVYA
jgi:pyruvate dehydrogenase E1 component alpha subunit